MIETAQQRIERENAEVVLRLERAEQYARKMSKSVVLPSVCSTTLASNELCPRCAEIVRKRKREAVARYRAKRR